MRRILRFLLPLLLVGAGVAIFMQLKSSGPEDMPAVVTERQWPVDAVRVEFRELRPTVRLYGRLESPAESRIRSALSTDVSASFALVGKAVGKGDVLLSMRVDGAAPYPPEASPPESDSRSSGDEGAIAVAPRNSGAPSIALSEKQMDTFGCWRTRKTWGRAARVTKIPEV